MEEKMVKCVDCGKEVPEGEVYRDGECRACRAKDRASDMTVGDLGGR